jgi:hypothetical protein
MSGIESRTVKPRATGSIRGSWRERYGDQRVDITVDPGRATSDAEVRVSFDRKWGPQLANTRTLNFLLSRRGAEILRDALTAALEWEDES